ncbi:MAG: argininosuccinate lyase [Phycisphaeraceae bacterium]|nr:argininosuccinate lyase [Phycisphaeraceae bacterium]
MARRTRSKRSPSGGKPWETAQAGVGSADDPVAARFVASLSYDRRLYRHDIAGSIAHAQMLADTGLITKRDLSSIRRGLRTIQRRIETEGDDWAGWKIDLEDVHMCIEAALIEEVGDPGRKLHTGRSRNDQVALDLRLWIDEAGGLLETACTDLMRAFVDLAGLDGEIVMPAYTHLQRAQPIVVGGELMAWVTAIDRCRQRLEWSRTFDPRQPLGSGAVAGSSLPLDRDATSVLLPGGRAPSLNAIDATASRDAALDFVYALSMLAMTLSRWSEQWIIYASTEFGFLRLDRRYTTGSSMMPQKKNPDMLELIRGRTGAPYGQLVALLTLCKGLPIGYNRDLQEDKRAVFTACDIVSDSVEMATRIVASTRFDEERIAANLDRGFLDATSLAEYLVTRGVPFRTAHGVVGTLVSTCVEQGLEQLSSLTLDVMNGVCADAGAGNRRCDDDVYEWLGAERVVRRYRTSGNAGLSGFRSQLTAWKRRLRK